MIRAHHCATCKDIPSPSCIRKGHMQECWREEHQGSFFAMREECPLCRDERHRLAAAERAERERLRKAESSKQVLTAKDAQAKKRNDAKAQKQAESAARKAAREAEKFRRNRKDWGDDGGAGPSSGMAA